MKVLRAIGNFFVRIWRWIKDTAWVQPLLIVGVIFAVIFSIPKVVEAVESAKENANTAETFYANFHIALKGGENSNADRLTNYIETREDAVDPSAEPEEEIKKARDDLGLKDKFFLMYVSKNCAGCKEAKGAFEILRDNFGKGKGYHPNDGRPFQLEAIFTDEVTDETKPNKTAFVQYMERHAYFFETAAGTGWNSAYYLNGKLQDSDLEALETTDPDKFLTPTLFLIDFTDNAAEYGVSEVMFGVPGDSDADKAQHLLDCWNGEEDFRIKD